MFGRGVHHPEPALNLKGIQDEISLFPAQSPPISKAIRGFQSSPKMFGRGVHHPEPALNLAKLRKLKISCILG
jgi:hypothetical protein